VEDDAERVALAREDAAHAVAHGGTVVAAGAGRGPVSGREDHRLALLEVDHAAARLGARALLDQQELPAREVLARLAQENRQLDGKDHLAVEILVEAANLRRRAPAEQRRGLLRPRRAQRANPMRSAGDARALSAASHRRAMAANGAYILAHFLTMGGSGSAKYLYCPPEAAPRHPPGSVGRP
jgi:hypothetical protein